VTTGDHAQRPRKHSRKDGESALPVFHGGAAQSLFPAGIKGTTRRATCAHVAPTVGTATGMATGCALPSAGRPDYRSDLDLIFANPDGSPLMPNSISSSVSLLCRQPWSVEGASLHTPRHSHQSCWRTVPTSYLFPRARAIHPSE